MPPTKVLLAGSVRGKFDALFTRVSAVHKSKGPFDMLLCAGQFFDPDDTSAGLADYVSGKKSAPMPTYFAEASTAAEEKVALELSASPADIHYLGRAGVKKLRGFLVAYFDGHYNAEAEGSSAKSMREVEQAVERASCDIDLFLTRSWPAGVAQGVPPDALPAGAKAPGSAAVAELVGVVRPRYHVSSDRDVFFARPPYVNRDLGAGAHVTRFLGLAAVDNDAQAKALHALALVPAADMDLATLHQCPGGTTACPYRGAAAPAKRPFLDAHSAGDGASDQPWRWQQAKRGEGNGPGPSLGRPGVVRDDRRSVFAGNLPFRASEAELEAFFAAAGPVVDIRRSLDAGGKLRAYGFVQYESEAAAERACELLAGAELLGRAVTVNLAGAAPSTARGAPAAGAPVQGCWFCLSNPSADTHLIASVGEETYVAVDKGPITPDHVLVLSIEHFPSQLMLPATTYAELERYLAALRKCFGAQGQDMVAFERYMTFRKSGGNHCQVNALAVPRSAGARAESAFRAAADAAGITLTRLPPGPTGEAGRDALRDVVGSGEFFVAHLPDGAHLVHAITRGERHPLNFGREVLAGLAGVGERADWKRCMDGSRNAEEARTARFKDTFKAFDIMQ